MLKLLQQQLQALLSVSDQSRNTLSMTDGGTWRWPERSLQPAKSGDFTLDLTQKHTACGVGPTVTTASNHGERLQVWCQAWHWQYSQNVQATSFFMSILWAWFRTAILFIWSNFLFPEWQWGVCNSEVCWGHMTSETSWQPKQRDLPSLRYRELSYHCNSIASLNFD